jgi:hypothetical protein
MFLFRISGVPGSHLSPEVSYPKIVRGLTWYFCAVSFDRGVILCDVSYFSTTATE